MQLLNLGQDAYGLVCSNDLLILAVKLKLYDL